MSDEKRPRSIPEIPTSWSVNTARLAAAIQKAKDRLANLKEEDIVDAEPESCRDRPPLL